MHLGSTKMYQDLKWVYWWRNMKREVAEFVSKCLVCQQVKAPRQKPAGLLQPLSAYQISALCSGKSTYTASNGAELYMSEIVRLHGVPVSIVSDRDARFTSKFWKGLQTAMGTRLDFSTAFHPQTDGQTERLNQVLEDMLRACALEIPGSCDSHLHLMKFAYNNSFQATIGMAPFEALYGKCCRSPICWSETAQSRQKSYADVRRKDLEFDVGDKVFLKVAPMKGVLRFERRGKLSSRFVGSFEILEQIDPIAYRLSLPPSLSAVHDVFHVSKLRKYVPDPSHVVDYEPLEIDENLSYTEQPVEVLAREVKMLRNREIPLVKVLWRNHRVEEATWKRENDRAPPHPFFLLHHLPHAKSPLPSLQPSLFRTRFVVVPIFDFVPISVAVRLATPPTAAVPVLHLHPASHRRNPRIDHPTVRSQRLSLPLRLRHCGRFLSPYPVFLTQPRTSRGAAHFCHRRPSFSHCRVDSLSVDSIEGHNQVSSKGFSYYWSSDRGWKRSNLQGIIRKVIASCSLCAIVCNELFKDRHQCPDILCIVVILMGYVVNWNCMSMNLKVLRLGYHNDV
ncbi:pol protein [Cucumis melo var. makuwa]|uniref:Pol protein n=1 Tax=Cucumis melo var. makuwa TaxID=1194695 RepID=A0A5A7SL85_CUCMM|nr:pol protein [Cucumis melo var. makuwa]